MGTDRLVYIRTDGNSNIATGHLVRCLSIADACLSLGMKVCFLVSDEESQRLLQDFDPMHKYPIQVLKTAVYDDLEKELPEVLVFLTSATQKSSLVYDTSVTSKDCVYFLDSYYVTEKYFSAIRAVMPIAYLDDLQLFDYPVDLVINYDVIPESRMPSYRAAYENASRKLLGASYTPLRSQFTGKNTPFREKATNILITTGGSDPYHFCLKLIETFQAKLTCHSCNSAYALSVSEPSVPFQLQVVIGHLNEDKAVLCELARELSFIHLHEKVSDMASLMESCDLAVSAAGTTLYELCAVGVPAVSFCMADNQITSANAFSDAGVIPYAGDIRTSCESVLSSVATFVTDMSENRNKRKTAHDAMKRLIDGKGALRIATVFSEL
ncbi:MAG: UDP-2,4-diacetamido-2,4,6-trideoxy-beta-L-altropyranose hydrolase [Suilimivivens sp.]